MPTQSKSLHFVLVSVEEAERPDGKRGEKWHRYVIANKMSKVVGYRSGTRQEVEEYVHECIGRLNERNTLRPRAYNQGSR